MSPLVEQDNYGLVPKQAVTAPNLKRAWFTSGAKDEIALDFGQPMAWKDEMKKDIYLDDVRGADRRGLGLGKRHHAEVEGALQREDDQLPVRDGTGTGSRSSLIFGANGIAALTFCDVGIAPSAAAEPARIYLRADVESLKQYETPEWFADAKLGIYMHWGPQSIPGVATTWYARWIYEQGSEGYRTIAPRTAIPPSSATRTSASSSRRRSSTRPRPTGLSSSTSGSAPATWSPWRCTTTTSTCGIPSTSRGSIPSPLPARTSWACGRRPPTNMGCTWAWPRTWPEPIAGCSLRTAATIRDRWQGSPMTARTRNMPISTG